jgi:hypothetical protein
LARGQDVRDRPSAVSSGTERDRFELADELANATDIVERGLGAARVVLP